MSDVLSVWAMDSDSALATISWQDAPPGSSDDQRFRIKNLSTIYTAYEIKLSVVGVGADQHWLSADGLSFYPTLLLGNLRPGAVSRAVTLRRVTPVATAVGAYTAAFRSQAAYWAK